MKKIFALLLAVSLCLCLFGCDIEETTDSEKNDKNEDTTEETTYSEKSEKYDEALNLITEGKYEDAYAIFEELGDFKDSEEQLAKFHYIPVDAIIKYVEGTYTEYINIDITLNDMNLIEQVYVSIGDECANFEWEYDENGNVIKIIEDSPNIRNHTEEYVYDENGNVVRCIETYGSGSIQVYEYEYDSNNNQTQKTIIWNDGSTSEYNTSYFYDSKGNITEKVETSDLGTDTSVVSTDTYTYIYGTDDRLIKATRTSSSWGTAIMNYSYDAQGNVIQVAERESSDTYTYYLYEYDNNGNIVKISKDGYNKWHEYDFDEHGNMTELRYIYSSGEHENVCTITYKLVYIDADISDEAFLTYLKNTFYDVLGGDTYPEVKTLG